MSRSLRWGMWDKNLIERHEMGFNVRQNFGYLGVPACQAVVMGGGGGHFPQEVPDLEVLYYPNNASCHCALC